MKKISILHPYLEDRINDIEKGFYPRNHLWGLDGLKTIEGVQIELLQSNSVPIPQFFEKLVNRLLFRNSPGVKAELSALRASRHSTLIYSVCGPLSLISFFGKTKVVPWVFRKPEQSTKLLLSPFSRKNLVRNAAFICLTKNAERAFKKHAPSRFLPWCVDLKMFDSKPAKKKPARPFFLATGKTGRDYNTLIAGAEKISIELRIIGPKQQRPARMPKNIKWIDTTEEPPDKAIDYPTLREWYAQCIAVCIPLLGDAQDTCGYTNMLEAMAMAKPVLMTASGCLHLKPADQNFGYSIAPGNSHGWTESMSKILLNKTLAKTLGRNGHNIVQNEFSVQTFDKELVSFLKDILFK